MNDNHFKFSSSVILLPFVFVLSLWVIFWSDRTFNLNLNDFGIYPRDLVGLRGIIFSPFLHGSMEHLYNNSIPIFILLSALRYFYREQFWSVVVFGILLSGFITWVIGRESHHIGASSLIYVLVSFIFFKGIRTKYYRLVALSLLVITIYGSMVWYIFPNIEEGISWEGHLGGLITGFVFSVVVKTPEYRKMIKYEWERPDFDASQDKFLQRFDENGNFVNLPAPEPEGLEEEKPFINVQYHFVAKPDSENNT